jgi:hypothetical protein
VVLVQISLNGVDFSPVARGAWARAGRKRMGSRKRAAAAPAAPAAAAAGGGGIGTEGGGDGSGDSDDSEFELPHYLQVVGWVVGW